MTSAGSCAAIRWVTWLLARSPGLDPARLDDVHFGNGNGAGEEHRNVARMASLLAGVPTSVHNTHAPLAKLLKELIMPEEPNVGVLRWRYGVHRRILPPHPQRQPHLQALAPGFLAEAAQSYRHGSRNMGSPKRWSNSR